MIRKKEEKLVFEALFLRTVVLFLPLQTKLCCILYIETSYIFSPKGKNYKIPLFVFSHYHSWNR